MNNINQIIIDQYLQGKLDPRAMNKLEKQALEDPFLADALEGYSYSSKPVGPQLSLLQQQLEERIARQQENKNVFNFTWQRLSIAAAGAVMFLLAAILFWMKSTSFNTNHTAAQPVEINISEAGNQSPQPENGWKSFENYVRSNLTVPEGTTGQVTLQFKIDTNGKPTDIRIQKGLTENINKEVIRLIENGPSWKTGTRQQNALVTIEFYK